MAHHVMWYNHRDGGSVSFSDGRKRNVHKRLVEKMIEKRPVKIRGNTRKDIVKYDKNSNTLGYNAV
jgi:hypothetical protein